AAEKGASLTQRQPGPRVPSGKRGCGDIMMRLNISVDCTPEEARAFLGLPNLTPVNETLVQAIKQRIEQNIELVSPEFYLKQWYSMGGQASDQFMQLMAAGARAATGQTPSAKK